MMTEKERVTQDINWLEKAIEDTTKNLQVLINERKNAKQKLKELERGD